MKKPRSFKQELTACFGQPVAENPTQVMMEAAFRHHGLDWRYLTIEVAPEGLGDAVRGAKVMGFAGFNCTIPHKVAVIDHLDGLGESAALMRAVNCVVRRDGKFIGENTDGKGFLKALREVTDPRDQAVVMFGAGGAARAIGVELALAGVRRITIVNRSPRRGEELVELLRSATNISCDLVVGPEDYSVPADANIVINATSVGLFPDVDARLPMNPATLRPHMIVADVIPNPPETPFLREAKARGCRVIDGLEMLVNQGVIGIEYWTGIRADATVMRNALEEVFGV
ncbi:MAG: shikimate dehydrogenase [Gemmataceae bacterium]|nr:shikimate dehydrogenase [Gemmataceae bacterium]